MEKPINFRLKWHGWAAVIALALATLYCGMGGGLVATMPPEGQTFIYWPYQVTAHGLTPGLVVVSVGGLVLFYALVRLASHLHNCLAGLVVAAGVYLSPLIMLLLVASLGMAGGYQHIASARSGKAVYSAGIEYDGEGYFKGYLCRCDQTGSLCQCQVVPELGFSNPDHLSFGPLPNGGMALYAADGQLLYTWPGDQP